MAIRARLESRLKARAEGEDWAGVEATLNEFTKQTPRDRLASKLTTLKDRGVHPNVLLKILINHPSPFHPS